MLLTVDATNRGPTCAANVPLCVYFRGKPVMDTQKIDLATTVRPPSLELRGASDQDEYTVMVYDPDAPSQSKPICRSYVHWIVRGVRATDGRLRGGHTVVDWQVGYY